MSPTYISLDEAMEGCLECLEPFNIYGDGVKRLDFHRGPNTINLNPFFEDMFGMRDEQFDLPDYDRHQTNINKDGSEVTTYNFTMEEFFQSFIPIYSPDEIADFFEPLLTENTMQSEAFVKKIRGFFDNYRVGFMRYTRPERDYSGYYRAGFFPPDDDIMEFLKGALREEDFPTGKKKRGTFSTRVFPYIENQNKIPLSPYLKYSPETLARITRHAELKSLEEKDKSPIIFISSISQVTRRKHELTLQGIIKHYKEAWEPHVELAIKIPD